MVNILIRNVHPDLHLKLVQAADAAGRSLQQQLLLLLEQATAVIAIEDAITKWRQFATDRSAAGGVSISTDEALSALAVARRERADDLAKEVGDEPRR